MDHTRLSRREFAALAAGAPVSLAVQPSGAKGSPPGGARSEGRATATLTAAQAVERIRQQIGVDWQAETVDGVKAGDTATTVTGIVTTSMATLAVLRQAVEAGANLVVTGQPTFYSRSDVPGPRAADPIVIAKQDFVARQRLVVYRLRDHWRRRTPDPAAQGLGDALGWTTHRVAGDASRYAIPAVGLDALVEHVKTRLGARGGVRVIGDPKVRVQQVALLPGSTPIAASLAVLPGADAVIAGEVREWESVEYARDVVHAGGRKALVLVGRVLSEEPGMQACATWLRTILPGVPVRHLTAGDPYWRP